MRFNATFVGGSTLRALKDNNIFKTTGMCGVEPIGVYYMGRGHVASVAWPISPARAPRELTSIMRITYSCPSAECIAASGVHL